MDQDRTSHTPPGPENNPTVTTTNVAGSSELRRNSPTSHYEEKTRPSAPASPASGGTNPRPNVPQHPLPPIPIVQSYETIPPGLETPGLARMPTIDNARSPRRRPSALDWVIPLDEERREAQLHRPKTVGERLQPTIITAESERAKYAWKAKMTGYALNIAIGLQVLLGALTTGLSAVTSGRQTSIMTSILGGLSTLVASYLARARGSNEPELSITRTKDLEKFIRECQAFVMDVGHTTGNEYDNQLHHYRRTFEELLGNANGERRLAPPV